MKTTGGVVRLECVLLLFIYLFSLLNPSSGWGFLCILHSSSSTLSFGRGEDDGEEKKKNKCQKLPADGSFELGT